MKIIEYIKHIRDVCRARREEAKAAKIAYQQEIEYAQANIGTIDYQTCKEHQREIMKRCLKNDYENLISTGMTAGISDDDVNLFLDKYRRSNMPVEEYENDEKLSILRMLYTAKNPPVEKTFTLTVQTKKLKLSRQLKRVNYNTPSYTIRKIAGIRGLNWRFGQMNVGNTEYHTSLNVEDDGVLTITEKEILFQGNFTSFRKKYKAIMAAATGDDKFLLLHYGTQKPAIFLTGKFSDIITDLINSMIENNE